MKITFVEKNYKIAKRFKDVITEKLEKLDKYFGEDASARVVCSKQGKLEKLELNISNKGILYRSEVTSANNYDNIDTALPKIEKQIVRDRRKFVDKRRKALPLEFLDEMPEVKLPDVFKKKTFDLEPTTIDEAKDSIERLGHAFYIFLNAETGKVNVLYRRNDEKFGLIEVNY